MSQSTDVPAQFQGLFAPLNFANFRNLLISNTLWWQAMWMEMIVVGWLVYKLTNSAFDVALIAFYRSIPLLITGFIAGPLANRYGRIRIVIFAQLLSVFVIGAITYLLWANRLLFWHIAVGAALFGTSWSLNWTARRAIVPDLVGKHRTIEAMLLENLTQNIARVFGPFSSGYLYNSVGVNNCYLAILIISLISFLIVLRVKVPSQPVVPNVNPWTLMREGLRYMRTSQPVMGALLVTVIMNFLAFPYQTILPIFTHDILHKGPFEFGILGACNGIGAFFGLYILNILRKHLSHGWIFSLGSGFQSLCLFFFAFATTWTYTFTLFNSSYGVAFPLAILLLILSGFGQAFFSVMQSTIMLTSTRDDMRDCAMGTLVLAIGAGPIGRLQIGSLTEAYGAPLALGGHTSIAVVSIIAVTAALPGFRSRLATKKEEGILAQDQEKNLE
ncbi:hypothetical protein CMK14_13875 [Candidatus Poribacteria bacterium]|nr:hypothetical protein [Candidatus Poribacteria bacterium]